MSFKPVNVKSESQCDRSETGAFKLFSRRSNLARRLGRIVRNSLGRLQSNIQVPDWGRRLVVRRDLVADSTNCNRIQQEYALNQKKGSRSKRILSRGSEFRARPAPYVDELYNRRCDTQLAPTKIFTISHNNESDDEDLSDARNIVLERYTNRSIRASIDQSSEVEQSHERDQSKQQLEINQIQISHRSHGARKSIKRFSRIIFNWILRPFRGTLESNKKRSQTYKWANFQQITSKYRARRFGSSIRCPVADIEQIPMNHVNNCDAISIEIQHSQAMTMTPSSECLLPSQKSISSSRIAQQLDHRNSFLSQTSALKSNYTQQPGSSAITNKKDYRELSKSNKNRNKSQNHHHHHICRHDNNQQDKLRRFGCNHNRDSFKNNSCSDFEQESCINEHMNQGELDQGEPNTSGMRPKLPRSKLMNFSQLLRDDFDKFEEEQQQKNQIQRNDGHNHDQDQQVYDEQNSSIDSDSSYGPLTTSESPSSPDESRCDHRDSSDSCQTSADTSISLELSSSGLSAGSNASANRSSSFIDENSFNQVDRRQQSCCNGTSQSNHIVHNDERIQLDQNDITSAYLSESFNQVPNYSEPQKASHLHRSLTYQHGLADLEYRSAAPLITTQSRGHETKRASLQFYDQNNWDYNHNDRLRSKRDMIFHSSNQLAFANEHKQQNSVQSGSRRRSLYEDSEHSPFDNEQVHEHSGLNSFYISSSEFQDSNICDNRPNHDHVIQSKVNYSNSSDWQIGSQAMYNSSIEHQNGTNFQSNSSPSLIYQSNKKNKKKKKFSPELNNLNKQMSNDRHEEDIAACRLANPPKLLVNNNEVGKNQSPIKFNSFSNQVLFERIILQGSTSELLQCLTEFIRSRCKHLIGFHPSLVICWIEGVDRHLINQGWQEISFINPANLVFVYLMLRGIVNPSRFKTIQDLEYIIMAALYLSYAYMGNEISYPLNPFITNLENMGRFWKINMDIINLLSGDMLRVNAEPSFFAEMFFELKRYQCIVIKLDNGLEIERPLLELINFRNAANSSTNNTSSNINEETSKRSLRQPQLDDPVKYPRGPLAQLFSNGQKKKSKYKKFNESYKTETDATENEYPSKYFQNIPIKRLKRHETYSG